MTTKTLEKNGVTMEVFPISEDMCDENEREEIRSSIENNVAYDGNVFDLYQESFFLGNRGTLDEWNEYIDKHKL